MYFRYALTECTVRRWTVPFSIAFSYLPSPEQLTQLRWRWLLYSEAAVINTSPAGMPVIQRRTLGSLSAKEFNIDATRQRIVAQKYVLRHKPPRSAAASRSTAHRMMPYASSINSSRYESAFLKNAAVRLRQTYYRELSCCQFLEVERSGWWLF